MKTLAYLTIGLIVVLLATPETPTTAQQQHTIQFGQADVLPVPNDAVAEPADDVILSRETTEALCEAFGTLLATETYYQFTIRIDETEISITPHSEPVKVKR